MYSVSAKRKERQQQFFFLSLLQMVLFFVLRLNCISSLMQFFSDVVSMKSESYRNLNTVCCQT